VLLGLAQAFEVLHDIGPFEAVNAKFQTRLNKINRLWAAGGGLL
jgi:hypothetical protein